MTVPQFHNSNWDPHGRRRSLFALPTKYRYRYRNDIQPRHNNKGLLPMILIRAANNKQQPKRRLHHCIAAPLSFSSSVLWVCMSWTALLVSSSSSSLFASQNSRWAVQAMALGRVYSAAAASSSTAAAAATSTAAATTSSTNTNNALLQMLPTANDDNSSNSKTNLMLPPFASIQASDVTPAVTTLLAQLEQDFAELEAKLASCDATTTTDDTTNNNNVVHYDDVLPVLERLQYPLATVWGVVGHLQGVQNSDALRGAHDANQPAVVQAMAKLSQSKPIYRALQGIQIGSDDNDITQQKKRAVALSLQRMKLGGVGLEETETKNGSNSYSNPKERFNEIQQRLAALATSFGNHVLDATKAFALTVTDPEDLRGAPATALAMWANAHAQFEVQQQQKDGEASSTTTTEPEPSVSPLVANAESGPWRITLDGPSYLAVLQHVANRDIREQVYRAHITRASSSSSSIGGNDDDKEKQNNVPLIYEILTLRHEMAQMLGFSNYAELSLASKMAPSIESVTELSDMMRVTALPAARKEWDEIVAAAVAAGAVAADVATLEPWDVSYWSERLKESKFSLTEEDTRPYFALPAVLNGMFSLVGHLFNIAVDAADGEAEVWHPDVRFFKVYNIGQGEDGKPNGQRQHIASFFLDPYARPENKRGGAWMDVCVGKSEAVAREIPVAYLTCNGSPPVGDSKPSLMTFREVETLFHEFGHGLQHMLTTATVGDVAGINGVEWDAVELPSQFMENW